MMRTMSSSASPSFSPRRKMAKSTGKKRRPSQKPPRRLSWPTSLSQNSNSSDDNPRRHSEGDGNKKSGRSTISSNKSNSARKRARFDPPSPENDTKSNSNTNESNVIWVQKYTPKSSADLCVAPKKVKEVKAWIEQAADRSNSNNNNHLHQRKKKLLVMVGSPGVGKSSCVRVLAQEMGLSLMTWNESFNPRAYGSSSSNTMFAVEQTSALDSFHEFLQQSGSGFSSLNMTDDGDSQQQYSTNAQSLILLEELPNLHGQDAEWKFRALMKQHLEQSQVPTVLIFSDVSEGKHKPEDLERLIDQEDLYDNQRTTIMQIHSVTKPKMKKVLTAIAKQEKCSVSPAYMEELHSHSHGDLRHAIMTMQLHASGTKTPSAGSLVQGQNDRDTKLSTFHSLGKLLYAKRTMENGVARLAFDPDNALERSDMGLEGSLKFLEYHSLDFYTDVTDISKAYEYFSDAVELLDQSTTSTGNGRQYHDLSVAYPYGCASAIAGRAVANTNKHPAPNKFRQFSRPKVFDVIRNGKQNKILLEQLSRRLSMYHGPVSSAVGGDTGTFVTESLPFVRSILPQEVDPMVNNLYSVAMQRYQSSNRVTKEEDVSLREQEEILGADDIEDFDSDDD